MNEYKREEAAARAAALLHNTGGTYAAAAYATGFWPTTISRWRRRLQVPRDASLSVLRRCT